MPESDAGSVGLIVFQVTVFWFCLTVVECFIYLFIYSIAGNAALPIPISVCSIVRRPKQWRGCQRLQFLTCAQIGLQIAFDWLCERRKESLH